MMALLAGTILGGPSTALAQTTLPSIIVTAPSPIVTRPSTPPAGATLADPSPVPPIVSDVFAPVTVVTTPEITRSAASTLGDLVFDKPGITATTFAPGGASRPVIRGLDSFRVRVQENGVGTHDVADLSEDHAVPVDPIGAQQVEIVRGPATLRYGSEAIGGVVEVSNNRIPTPPFAKPGVEVVTKGGYSSVDNGRDGAIIVDGGTSNFALHLDAHARRADDYRIPGGRQENSALNTEGQSIGGTYFFDHGYFGAALTHFTSLYHIPGLTSAPVGSRIDLEQTKVTGKGEFRPPGSGLIDAVRVWLGATNYKHDELARDDAGDDGVRSTFKNKEQEGRVEVQLLPFATPLGPVTTALGLQAQRQRLSAGGEAGELLAPNGTDRIAAFVFNEMRVSETVRLQTAGRIEHVNLFGTAARFPADLLGGVDPVEFDLGRRFTPVSASAGVLVDLPWFLVATGTAQYVERAPRTAELFSKGPHDATRTFEIGDFGLTKEVAKTVEVGLKRPQGRFRFEANAYHTRYDGFIFKSITGIICGDGFDTCGLEDELTQVVFSQRDATFTGAEIAATFDVAPLGDGMFGVDGQYDIVRARFSDGAKVPRIPPQRIGGGVWWRNAHWFARVGLLHAFAQDRIALNETPTGGYDLLRAEVSYTKRFAPNDAGVRELTIGVRGDNLLDDEVRNHVQFRKDEVQLPGRNVRAFATLRF